MALEDVIQNAVDVNIHGEEPSGHVDAGETNESEALETLDSGEITDNSGEVESETNKTIDDTGESAAEAAAAAARKAADDAEQNFAREYELVDKQGKRENRIPYNRVKKIVENAQIKIAKQVLGDQWKDLQAGQKIDDVLNGHLSTINQRLQAMQAYEQELERVQLVGNLIQSDPDRFLAVLPNINPRYAELLNRQPMQKNPEDEMPGPDLDLGGGAKTYSPEGLRNLLDWQAQQTEKRVLGTVDKDLRPLREQQHASEQMQAALTRVRSQLSEARKNWKGFTDNEPAIQKYVERGMKLEIAYAQVMQDVYEKKLQDAQANREKVRAEVLEELKKAPRSTATAVSSRSKAADEVGEPTNLEDVIRNALKTNKG